ncbi:MAG: HNH endonuclease signature motif containing protein [Dehalococcoidia bacterium]
MPFSTEITDRAWDRQYGKCAYCGKRLNKKNRNEGETGAWHPHHRKPEKKGGSNKLRNCAILCINEPEKCHFKIGHGGKDWSYYSPISDSDLQYLFASRKKREH